MNLYLTRAAPDHSAIHIDLAGRDAPASGAALTLTDPAEILAAARATSRHDTDWVVWRLASMPGAGRRAAAFAIAIARAVQGDVFVVLERESQREQQIAGHLLRAGARSV